MDWAGLATIGLELPLASRHEWHPSMSDLNWIRRDLGRGDDQQTRGWNEWVGHGLDTPSLVLSPSIAIGCLLEIGLLAFLDSWRRLCSFRCMSVDRTNRMIVVNALDTSSRFLGWDAGWCDESTKDHLTMPSTWMAWSYNSTTGWNKDNAIVSFNSWPFPATRRQSFDFWPTLLFLSMVSIVDSSTFTHQWFSGKIHRCHRWAPRSIRGWCKCWTVRVALELLFDNVSLRLLQQTLFCVWAIPQTTVHCKVYCCLVSVYRFYLHGRVELWILR